MEQMLLETLASSLCALLHCYSTNANMCFVINLLISIFSLDSILSLVRFLQLSFFFFPIQIGTSQRSFSIMNEHCLKKSTYSISCVKGAILDTLSHSLFIVLPSSEQHAIIHTCQLGLEIIYSSSMDESQFSYNIILQLFFLFSEGNIIIILFYLKC